MHKYCTLYSLLSFTAILAYRVIFLLLLYELLANIQNYRTDSWLPSVGPVHHRVITYLTIEKWGLVFYSEYFFYAGLKRTEHRKVRFRRSLCSKAAVCPTASIPR